MNNGIEQRLFRILVFIPMENAGIVAEMFYGSFGERHNSGFAVFPKKRNGRVGTELNVAQLDVPRDT